MSEIQNPNNHVDSGQNNHEHFIRGGHIAALIIFALAALIGFVTPGAFADLKVWGVWCAVCAVLALIALLRTKKQLKGGSAS